MHVYTFEIKEKINRIYADDILISGKEDEIREIIQKLKSEYELKNLGELSFYLGMKIKKTADGYQLIPTLK